MRVSRFYCPDLVSTEQPFYLPERAHKHAVQVLRLKVGDSLQVFDGEGNEWHCKLEAVEKKQSTIRLLEKIPSEVPSALSVTLLQGISKGDRMDYAIQKAVELGVERIVPVQSERCNVQLSGPRAEKKLSHWKGVMISACEQSGRNRLPVLSPIALLSEALTTYPNGLVLDPLADLTLKSIAKQPSIPIAIGPEGGFSEEEITLAKQSGFQAIQFGPRILRTETAAVAVMSALQTLWGDLA